MARRPGLTRARSALKAQPAPPPDRAYQLRGRFLLYILGTALVAMAGVGALFALYAALVGEGYAGYLVVALSLPAGLLLRRFGSPGAEPSPREAILGVLLTWLLLPGVSAAPYVFSAGLTPLDALFEAMSGFTTTGATTMTDLGNVDRSLLIWRSLSQWVGGVGIVVIFVGVFPRLAIAGRQLFYAETPGPTEEHLSPRLRGTAVRVVTLYAGLTLLAMVAFALTGMGAFDSVAHALASLAAGGFSPNPLGIQAYGAAAQWVALVFMVLAGMSFPLLYRSLTGRPRSLWSAETRAYLLIMLVAGLLLALLTGADYDAVEALRHGLFQAVSITTTTGLASADFAGWSAPAQAVLALLLFVGGSAGSASGGVKVARWLIIARHVGREVRRALHPRAVMTVRLGNQIIPDDVLRSVFAFLTLFLALFVAGGLALILLGEEPLTALTAAIACLSSTGTGLGTVGPSGSFAGLQPGSRAVLTFLMYAGRLEVVIVFVLLDPTFWRRPRWGGGRRAVRLQK